MGKQNSTKVRFSWPGVSSFGIFVFASVDLETGTGSVVVVLASALQLPIGSYRFFHLPRVPEAQLLVCALRLHNKEKMQQEQSRKSLQMTGHIAF